MSFWLKESELVEKRFKLKPAVTRVTTCSGIQYTEQKINSSDLNLKNRPRNLVLECKSDQPGYVVDTKPDLDIGSVTDNILIGSIDAASDSDILKEHRVTHILSVAPLFNYELPIAAEHLSLDILDLPETNLGDYYTEAFTFINKAIEDGGRVLIHCNAGVSRSAAITIAYLMKTQSISYDSAWTIVKEKRPAINPNIGFILQLKQLEQKIFGN